MTEEEYLASEETSPIKREFLGGWVCERAGANDPHNIIATNLTGILYQQLRGKRCQNFGSDMKVRLRRRDPDSTYYYYPDQMIACDPADANDGCRERPSALFEIVSERTRRTDDREKRLVYLELPSLEAYMRIEQARPEVVVDFRTPEGWKPERFTGLDKLVPLAALGLQIALAELYEKVAFLTLPARLDGDEGL